MPNSLMEEFVLSPLIGHQFSPHAARSTTNPSNPYIYVKSYLFVMDSERNNNFINPSFGANVLGVDINSLGLPYMHAGDFEKFDRAFLTVRGVRRAWGSPVRLQNAKIWVLIDEYTASAGEHYVAIMKYSNFATVVGQPTMGIPGRLVDIGARAYISLPNSGIGVQYDFAYMTDVYGNAWEGYGIAPHYFNRPGMDALETVLAMIAEQDND